MTPSSAGARWLQTSPLARADEDVCPPGYSAIWTGWITRHDGVAEAQTDSVHALISWMERSSRPGDDTRIRRSIIPTGSDEHLAALAAGFPDDLEPAAGGPSLSARLTEERLRSADEAIEAAETVVAAAVVPPAPTDPEGVIQWIEDHIGVTGGDAIALITGYGGDVATDLPAMGEVLPIAWSRWRTGTSPTEWLMALIPLWGLGAGELASDPVTLYRAVEGGVGGLGWTLDRITAHGLAARAADLGGDGRVYRVEADLSDIIAVLGDDIILDSSTLDFTVEDLDDGAAAVFEERHAAG